MEVVQESFFQVLPAADRIFRQAVKPVPSWPFELEREVFNGVEIISSSHVDVEDEILDPHCGIGCAVV